MENANTFKRELSTLKSRVVEAIEANLKRIGRTHSDDDDEPLDFFSFSTTAKNDIIGINADGTLLGTEVTIRGAVKDDTISLEDAVDLLEDLEQL